LGKLSGFGVRTALDFGIYYNRENMFIITRRSTVDKCCQRIYIESYSSSPLEYSFNKLVDGVHTELSRVTVYKTVKLLQEEGVLQDRKRNRRDHRFYVDANNPLVLIPKQLEEIETTFNKLLNKSKPYWEDISKQRINALKELNVDLLIELYGGTKSLVYFVPTMILQMITDFITIHARTIWINKIADKDTLNKLFGIVFMKLASLNSDYVDYLRSIHHSHPEVVQFDNSVVNRVYLPLQLSRNRPRSTTK
jgi:hypothetical protein